MGSEETTQAFTSQERAMLYPSYYVPTSTCFINEENVVSLPTKVQSPSAFARLIPFNDAARQSFHEVAQASRDGKLLPHHAQFLAIQEAVRRTAPKLMHNAKNATCRDNVVNRATPRYEQPHTRGKHLN